MIKALALALLLCATAPSWALEYRAMAEPSILYDAPATKAKKLFIIARQTPVEVVVSVGAWTKVRDSKGDLAWVETQRFGPGRTVIVRVDRAAVYADADEKSVRMFDAAREVVLDLLEAAPPGWAKVRHRDGQVGFIKAGQVWGL